MLRRLDLALNKVQMTKDEIKGASSDVLKAQESAESPCAAFRIDIPPVLEDFPDQSRVKAPIYPLPLSHENQCTIVGTASNLELFSSEFGFKSSKAKKYLPLKKSGKDFDLERAYQRYAFLKALEQHKVQQNQYEHILRHEAVDESHLEFVEHDTVDDDTDADENVDD